MLCFPSTTKLECCNSYAPRNHLFHDIASIDITQR